MDDVAPSRPATLGWGVLVALGWYVTIAAAVLVGWSGVPVAPDPECSGWCLTRAEASVLFLMAGAPVLLVVLLPVTVAAVALLVGRVRSALLAGTLAVPVSVAVTAVVWSAVQ